GYYGDVLIGRASTSLLSLEGTLQTASDQQAELRNLGDAAVQVTSLSITGTNPDQFGIISAPSLPFTIQPQSSVSVAVRFSPTSSGLKSAVLTASNNSIVPVSTAVLEGVGGLSGCDPTLTPNDYYAPADGAVGNFTVSTVSCSWTVSTDDYWIHPTANGQKVEFSIERNTLGLQRVGTINLNIDHRIYFFTIYQDGNPSGCTLSLSDNNGAFASIGGSGTFNVSTPANCIWSAISVSPWININTQGVHAGSQTVSYTVAPM